MTKRSYIIILAFLLIFSAVLAVGSTTMLPTANAAVLTSDKNFDETEIEDDLGGIDLSSYPANPLGRLAVFELIEYCYSDNAFRQGNYGIYIYLYNPQQINFSTKSGASSVNIATEYNEAGEPSGYSNLQLSFLDKTDDGVFYKFKVSNPIRLLDNAKAHSKEYGNRRYDVAGVQLRELGQATSTDYGVGGSYVFTGYAAGYGSSASAESTLDCEMYDLETLSLDVHHTFYRPEGTNIHPAGEEGTVNTQDQLNSVYFSVPNSVLEKYGDFSAIHAEWYEYRTKPVFVTANTAVYNHLKNYIGYTVVNGYDDQIQYGFASDYYNVREGGIVGGALSHLTGIDYAYNLNIDPIEESEHITIRNGYISELYYLFQADTSTAGEYVISGEDLISYMLDYSADKSDLILDKYARELLTDDVGAGRTPGYNEVNIGSDFEYDLISFSDPSWWNYFLGIYDFELYRDIKAIYAVSDSDFALSTEETCDNLFIDESDYLEFKFAYDAAKANDETLFLFRFAVTDYYGAQCAEFDSTERLKVYNGDYIDTNAYMAMENVFLDFDIIDTTFGRDGVYTVIPAVSDPIDIVSYITPPNTWDTDSGCGNFSLWTLLWIVLVVIALIILIPLLPTILVGIGKIILFVITLPFKIGKAIAKKIKERKAAKAAKPPKSKTKEKAKAKPKRRSAAKVKYPKYKVKRYRYGKKK